MNTTRRWLTHLSAFFFVLFMAFGLTSYADDGMKVHFLNVGQADSTLITCGDHAMLIDAGKNDDKEPILNYIQNKAGLTHLDYMIGTHPHEDHIGSMDSVIEAVSVDTVMLPNVTANTRTFQDVLTAIDEKGLSITVPEVGETYSDVYKRQVVPTEMEHTVSHQKGKFPFRRVTISLCLLQDLVP